MNGNLAQAVGRAFAADGPLARSDPHFLARAAQDTLAARIAQAVAGRETLVAEAGTGVGKTFAYLVPLLLSGRRALISTATKSLQDQLFLRDLPRLRDALRVPVRMALLKGRASYLCRHRLIQARVGAQLPDRFAVRALHRVAQWAQATQSGDLAEIEGLDDRSPVIPLVTSTRDNCLGSECPEFRACHVMQARREAMAADLVVVNHHLFFADMALRDSGVAELLPTVDVAVFDEAHQLVEAGVQFLGTTLATGQATSPPRCATVEAAWASSSAVLALSELRATVVPSSSIEAAVCCKALAWRWPAWPKRRPTFPSWSSARERSQRWPHFSAARRPPTMCAGSISRRSRRGWSSRRWTSGRC